MSGYKNNFSPLVDNYLAFFIAITSPIEVSVEESFMILDGRLSFPREREITPQMFYEIALRVNENTLSYYRLERKYSVNRRKIKKIADFIREVKNESTANQDSFGEAQRASV